MRTAATDPLIQLTPANRNSLYAELRDHMPVYWSTVHNAWVVTPYPDVRMILGHPDSLVMNSIPFLETISRRGGMDLSRLIQAWASISFFMQAPRHDTVRRMFTQVLAGIWRTNIPQQLDQYAERLLANGERDGSIDLVACYGKALALFVIGSFLGVPEGDLPQLSDAAVELVALLEKFIPSPVLLQKLDEAARTMLGYFEQLIAHHRRSGSTDGASLMMQLADERLECSTEELAGFCTFFFVAGEETTALSISEAARIVLGDEKLRARLSKAPSQLTQAARELLRLISPVQYILRQMRVDLRLHDQLIPAGEPIILMLGAANRDPTVFPDPDEVCLDREGPEPLTFAVGPYRCVGAQLATFEIEVAVRKLLERPQLQLSPEPPSWTDRVNIVPLKRLHAYFGKRGE